MLNLQVLTGRSNLCGNRQGLYAGGYLEIISTNSAVVILFSLYNREKFCSKVIKPYFVINRKDESFS